MARLPERGVAEYLALLQQLLPQGLAWTRAPGSRLAALLGANAEECGRVDARAHWLISEIHPATALDGLEDWERVLGLPDECNPGGTTLAERRSAVLARLRDTGRQDLAWWYELAASLGFEVTIEEHWPFVCGVHECGDPSALSPREAQEYPQIGYLGPEEMRLWWSVTVHGDRLLPFRCGESLLPERLLDWRVAEALECLMLRDREAHTLLTFSYEED